MPRESELYRCGRVINPRRVGAYCYAPSAHFDRNDRANEARGVLERERERERGNNSKRLYDNTILILKSAKVGIVVTFGEPLWYVLDESKKTEI